MMAGISLRWLNRGVAIQTPHHHSVVILARVRCCTSELPSVVGQAMAPKTAPKKQTAEGLTVPVVSASDIAKAKEALQDAKAKKRKNSNMMYWLQKTGNKEAFDASSLDARREFFVGWFADKMSKGETTSSGSKDIGTVRTSGQEYTWVSKYGLEKTLGQEKAQARIASGKMQTRADPVTGSIDEWSLEYKLLKDVGSSMEREAHNLRLETAAVIKSEAEKAEVMEDWFAARLQESGETVSSSPGVYIKKELPEEESKNDKQKTEAQKKLNKTIETLTTDPRKILKVVGETVITLKCMFQSTLAIRYTEQLNEDIGKLLPRFKTDFKGVETLATKSSHDLEQFASAGDGGAVIRAMAVKLEGNFEKYNELCDWHSKFVPNNSKKPRKY